MAYTQQQLDALDVAIGNQVKEVWEGDRKVVYNSFDDMIRARNMMAKSLLSPSVRPSNRIVVEFSKGL